MVKNWKGLRSTIHYRTVVLDACQRVGNMSLVEQMYVAEEVEMYCFFIYWQQKQKYNLQQLD